MARCFIGIMLPDDLKSYIEGINHQISALPIKCKLVERENFHICLSFLGQVEDPQIPAIVKKMDFICSNVPSFTFNVGGIKIIPSESYVRVLALEVRAEAGTSEPLIKGILKEIGGDSHPPHITLCRVKSIPDKQSTIEKIKAVRTDEKLLSVSSIHLVKSELGRSGPAYSIVHSSKLL